MAMEIHQFISPPLRNNVYLVWDDATAQAAVIDPAMAAEDIRFYASPRRIRIEFIINTHAHFDHVWENAKLKKITGAKLCIGREDVPMLENVQDLIPPHIRQPLEKAVPDVLLKEGDSIVFGKESLSVLHTPGHTPGSICLYHEKSKTLFTGDTVFAGTYGRTDLPNSDPGAMQKSLARIMQLPPETHILPGHGPAAVLGKESWLKAYGNRKS